MTIALIRVLIDGGGVYNWETAVLKYSAWTHSGPKDIGTNTRFLSTLALLSSALPPKTWWLRVTNKTVKGYISRWKKREEMITSGEFLPSLANGALMRCCPFAVLSDDKWLNYALEDVKLTNDYRETIGINVVYLHILRALLEGVDLLGALEIGKKTADSWTTGAIRDILYSTIDDPDYTKDVTVNKGLAENAFYCAIAALVMVRDGYDYPSIIQWVITQGTEVGKGDTDTNAAIAGALLGAHFGYTKLMEDDATWENWDTLIATAQQVEGPLRRYYPVDFEGLIDELMTVS